MPKLSEPPNRNFGHLFSDIVCSSKPGDFPIGSLQSRAAARALVSGYVQKQCDAEGAILREFGAAEQASVRALIESQPEFSVRLTMLRLMRVALERSRVYKQPLNLPTPEKIRENRRLEKDMQVPNAEVGIVPNDSSGSKKT